MKIDILTYKYNSWFSKKTWVAICQTKLPIDIPNIFAETETEAFNQMKDQIIGKLIYLEKDANYSTRSLEVDISEHGTSINSRWTGPALRK